MRHTHHSRRAALALASLVACSAISTPAWAIDHFCDTSQEFTTALNNSNPGDTITLQAGMTFTSPAGGFVLPIKSGSDWITIRSSNLTSLPAEGTRVNLSHASNMPQIRPGDHTSPAIKTATSTTTSAAHHFKLIGLDVTGTQSGTVFTGYGLIDLGTAGSTQDTLIEVPHHFVIDRCILRAASDTHRIKRGIGLNSADTDVTNCHISGIKDASNDTQAINGINGPGPFNIINNYLEGACENVMFGGGTPTVPNLVPSDIVIQKNHFFKPLTWNQNHSSYAGNDWSIKNLFELKNGRNVLLEGNIFENHWADAQAGWGIVLTPANDGPAPWTVVENITFRKNIFRNMSMGPNILAFDQGGDPSLRTNRITFENNLFYNIGGPLWQGTGRLMQIVASSSSGGMDQFKLIHNTAFQTDYVMSVSGPQNTNTEIRDNMLMTGPYGFKGSAAAGNDTFNNHFSGPSGIIYQKNVLMDNASSSQSHLANTLYSQYAGGWSPNTLQFPQGWSGVLVNQGDPTPEANNFAGWKVVTGSAYDNAATDGTDIGCNIDEVVAATAGCISGVWSGGPPPSGLIAYDGFNYTGNLNTQNGGSGFANAWTAVSGQGNPALNTGSLTYVGGPKSLTTVGNKLQPGATNQSVRNFTSPINAASSTKWVSFRAKRTVTGTMPSNHVGFPLYPSANGAGTSIFLGKPGAASNWGIDIGGTVATATGTPSLDAFLLYKLVFTSTQVTVSMWVNPSLASESGLGTAQAVTPAVSHGGVLSSMKMSTGANATSYQLDEFRIGGGFADVTPGTPVEVIVDNTDPSPAVTFTGSAWTTSTWTGGGDFVGTNYLHDANGTDTKTIRWTPTLPAAGSYEVFAQWTSNTDRTTAALYTVQHASGAPVVSRSQQTGGTGWQSLGIFTFNATGGYVQLSTAGTSGIVVADAIRFVKQ